MKRGISFLRHAAEVRHAHPLSAQCVRPLPHLRPPRYHTSTGVPVVVPRVHLFQFALTKRIDTAPHASKYNSRKVFGRQVSTNVSHRFCNQHPPRVKIDSSLSFAGLPRVFSSKIKHQEAHQQSQNSMCHSDRGVYNSLETSHRNAIKDDTNMCVLPLDPSLFATHLPPHPSNCPSSCWPPPH